MGLGSEGITVWPVSDDRPGRLQFEMCDVEATGAGDSAAVDRAWTDLRRENPRLFDGPVLLVDLEGVRSGRMRCWRGSYKQIATAPIVGARARSLGVQGVVVGRDADGDEVVLMGRRSSETRIYGGMWENAPSGTVEPPPRGETVVDRNRIVGALARESLEELGLRMDTADPKWIAWLDDAHARSIDAVFRRDVGPRVDARRHVCPAREGRWEYVDSAWVPTSRLDQWIKQGAAVSPPTRGLFEFLGWTKQTST